MKEIANRKIVIEALTGSYNYNLAVNGSDRDYKYFVAPSFDDLYNGKFFSNAKQSDTFDYSVHDIRQLGNLIWKANLNFIEVLFSKDLTFYPALRWIFENREELATMNLPAFARATYGMYLDKMRNLFKGTEKTKPLVEKYGYDTKEACHALRCLFTLQRLADSNSFGDAIWYSDDDENGKMLIDIKSGVFAVDEFCRITDTEVPYTENAMVWCERKKPNENLKNQLDEVIKKFVRDNLF